MSIHKLLKKAVGKKVVYTLTGGGAGSIWNLELEDGIGFMIYCAWRVEQGDFVLTTDCDDATAIVGHMNQTVQRLVGCKLLSYELSKHYDLILHFEDDFLVRVFCNLGFEAPIKEDYPTIAWDFSISSLDIVAIITKYFQVVYTKHYSNDIIEESEISILV